MLHVRGCRKEHPHRTSTTGDFLARSGRGEVSQRTIITPVLPFSLFRLPTQIPWDFSYPKTRLLAISYFRSYLVSIPQIRPLLHDPDESPLFQFRRIFVIKLPQAQLSFEWKLSHRFAGARFPSPTCSLRPTRPSTRRNIHLPLGARIHWSD